MLVLSCAGLKCASPAKLTLRSTEPGAGAAAMVTLATPLTSVAAANIWPAKTNFSARLLSGFPLPSVSWAARVRGSLKSAVAGTAYARTPVPGAGGCDGVGHGSADTQVVVT